MLALHETPVDGVDAADRYGIWKLADALFACAFDGRWCEYALGNTPEQRSMGAWSDGVPVVELQVTEECGAGIVAVLYWGRPAAYACGMPIVRGGSQALEAGSSPSKDYPMVSLLASLLGLILIVVILFEAFETIILPRRVTRRLRLTRGYFLTLWPVWVAIAHRLPGGVDREGEGRRKWFLALFGPLGLLLLLALWASGLVLGFAMLIWGVGGEVTGIRGRADFGDILYMSGTTFFTVGFGDVTPHGPVGRLLAVGEGATGFSFLAVIIGYLPVIFTNFAQRETAIVLLDARAGSPPSAAAFLRRIGPDDDGSRIDHYLREWEQWSAELLESHLSYPVLSFFRSQHERQSWLAALTLILDVSALVIVGVRTEAGKLSPHQARLTFAMARHTVGDLCQVLNSPPLDAVPARLTPVELDRLRVQLGDGGIALCEGEDVEQQLAALRALYEPYVAALSARVLMKLPGWTPVADGADDWETTAWQWDPAVARTAVAPAGPADRV